MAQMRVGARARELGEAEVVEDIDIVHLVIELFRHQHHRRVHRDRNSPIGIFVTQPELHVVSVHIDHRLDAQLAVRLPQTLFPDVLKILVVAVLDSGRWLALPATATLDRAGKSHAEDVVDNRDVEDGRHDSLWIAAIDVCKGRLDIPTKRIEIGIVRDVANRARSRTLPVQCALWTFQHFYALQIERTYV